MTLTINYKEQSDPEVITGVNTFIITQAKLSYSTNTSTRTTNVSIDMSTIASFTVATT